ncbi:MAG: PQQ-binding-like beta-propeller repeat protein [Pyrinomonadaceae bacterium]
MPAGFLREIREAKNVSNFTLADDALYFGAGYNLYRLDLSSRLIERIYTTDRVIVEQPIITDGTVFFGGRSGIDKYGWRGEDEGFFAVDLESRKVQWKFSMADGYGTFGTYPVLAEDRILACARWHLHSLDRKTGKELWRIDNWMGSTGDTVTIPYVFDNHAYFIVAEEQVAASQKTDENDGHWAEVDLENGERTIFHIAERPGTYEDSSGQAVGTLVDGVIYGNNRVDHFGALDLRAKRLLWELPTDTHIKPVVLNGKVFLVRNEEIQAVDQRTGKTIWAKSLSGISRPISNTDQDHASSRFEELYTRRVTSDGQVLIVQGSTAIAAFDLATGKQKWRTEMASKSTPVIPLIIGANAFVLSDTDCSIVALDVLAGKELWRIGIPDCTFYQVVND